MYLDRMLGCGDCMMGTHSKLWATTKRTFGSVRFARTMGRGTDTEAACAMIGRGSEIATA
jgi:hypothetical protein